MIIRLVYTEDDISVEERNRILEEVTSGKERYVNYAALKEDCAKRRGYSNWGEYQKVLIKRQKERKRKNESVKVIFVKESEGEKRAREEKLEKSIFSGMF